MKILCIAMLVLVLLLNLISCSLNSIRKNTDDQEVYYSVEPCYGNYSFEDRVNNSTDIVRARRIESKDDYNFEIIESYRGVDIGSKISYQYSPPFSYNIGKEYYLLMVKVVDVFAEHDYYVPSSSEIYLPVESLDPEATCELLETFRNSTPPDVSFKGYDYIHSNDLAIVFQESDVVVLARAVNVSISSSERDVFNFEVLECLKGDKTTGDVFSTVLPKQVFGDKKEQYLKDGETLILALNRHEDSSLLTVSSKISIINSEEYKEIIGFFK